MKKFLARIICLFRGHKKISRYFPGKESYYYYKCYCERCWMPFGMPHLTEEYIEKNFPIPKERPNIDKEVQGCDATKA